MDNIKRVAVTGLGAVTPIGNDVLSFWHSLTSGKNGIAPITAFDCSDMRVKLAAELKDFDPLLRLEKPLSRKLDPYAVYALYAACEAMDDSRAAGSVAPEELGVYFGSGIGGFQTMNSEHTSLLEGGPRKVTPQFISKMISNIAAGNIAIRFNAHGPCICHTTACASSTTAVGEAYRAIRHGYTTAIICGGAEACVTPLAIAGFANSQTLSTSDDPDAASLPFDRRRGGFVMGEGAGALVLEEYSHAVARGARIYCEIVGYGSSCDAYHVTSPNPDVTYSARAVTDCLSRLPDFGAERLYLNAHGTGTKLNDKTETQIIKTVFGSAAERLHISSTKSMTGHMLGAAGAVEAIAAILALEKGIIPPTINLCEPDPECDLDYTPVKAQKAQLDAALSLSLGFGGHNACLAFRRAEA